MVRSSTKLRLWPISVIQVARGDRILAAAANGRSRRLLPALAIGATCVAVGQALQVLIGPYSRLQGTYIRQAGIAALAPDSDYYLQGGSSLAAILEAPWTNWSYLVIARLGHATGDAATALASIQLVAAIGVTAALYTVARDAAGVAAGGAAAAAFAINPLTAQWFRFVLTETLFFTAVIAVVLIAGRTDAARRSSHDVPLVGIGMFAAFMRPNGVLILLSVLAIIALRRFEQRHAGIAIVGLVLLAPVLLGLGHLATGDPAEGALVSQVYRGVVIEGTSDVQFLIEMPPSPDPNDESLGAGVAYVAKHPLAAGRLFLARIVIELAQVRPHYPTPVNVTAGLAALLFLAAAVAGLRDHRLTTFRRPALFVVVPLLALIGLTFATPEARYGWGALVALAPFVGVGITRFEPLRRQVTASRGARR